MVLTPVPAIVTFLNIVVAELVIVCAAPLKITVLEFAAKVPLLFQLPLTVNVFVPDIVNDELVLIVILLQVAEAPIIGLLGTLGINILLDEVGTEPLDQFVAVAQSVLVAPVQELGIFNIPVLAAKYVVFVFAAPEVVPPHIPPF
jgi:hypothetical protein